MKSKIIYGNNITNSMRSLKLNYILNIEIEIYLADIFELFSSNTSSGDGISIAKALLDDSPKIQQVSNIEGTIEDLFREKKLEKYQNAMQAAAEEERRQQETIKHNARIKEAQEEQKKKLFEEFYKIMSVISGAGQNEKKTKFTNCKVDKSTVLKFIDDLTETTKNLYNKKLSDTFNNSYNTGELHKLFFEFMSNTKEIDKNLNTKFYEQFFSDSDKNIFKINTAAGSQNDLSKSERIDKYYNQFKSHPQTYVKQNSILYPIAIRGISEPQSEFTKRLNKLMSTSALHPIEIAKKFVFDHSDDILEYYNKIYTFTAQVSEENTNEYEMTHELDAATAKIIIDKLDTREELVKNISKKQLEELNKKILSDVETCATENRINKIMDNMLTV